MDIRLNLGKERAVIALLFLLGLQFMYEKVQGEKRDRKESSLLVYCDFETECDGFIEEEYKNRKWLRLKESQPSSNNIKTNDQTNGEKNGYYVYTVFTSAGLKTRSSLTSRPLLLNGDTRACLKFRYKIFGDNDIIFNVYLEYKRNGDKELVYSGLCGEKRSPGMQDHRQYSSFCFCVIVLLVIQYDSLSLVTPLAIANNGHVWRQAVVGLEPRLETDFQISFEAVAPTFKHGGLGLDEIWLQAGPCEQTDSDWGAWTAWSTCKTSCGKGIKSRFRSCHGGSCIRKGVQIVVCDTGLLCRATRQASINKWGSWDSWGKCSVTCGTGARERRRFCTGQQPNCIGSPTDQRPCTMSPCPAFECRRHLDLAILVDSSDAVDQRRWTQIKEFVNDIIDRFDVGLNKTRISVIQFFAFARVWFHLDRYGSKDMMTDAVRSMTHDGGGTNTQLALNLLHTEVFKSSNGDRADIPNVCIIFTDGKSTVLTQKTIPEAYKVKSDGIKILSVGLSSKINESELNVMTSRSDWVFRVEETERLSGIIGDLVLKTCHSYNQTCMAHMDICFVVDTSGSINAFGADNWDHMRNFISNVVNKLDIGPNAARIAIVQFSGGSKIYFNFTKHEKKSQILKAIFSMPYYEGGTNIYAGLNKMRSVFSNEHGDRQEAENVAIIITDGSSTSNKDLTIPEAIKARSENITILAFGVTDSINKAELEGIAGHPQNVFATGDFTNLNAILDILLASTCQEMWSEWSACNVSCGEGIQRRRKIYGRCECRPPVEVARTCNKEACPYWGTWGACSVSCANGVRSRIKVCPGEECPPPTEERVQCFMSVCPYWGPWGGCNVSCGNGIRRRTKVCPGEQCPPPTEDSEQCSMPACPYWGPWGGCNVSCGNGIRRRTKVCPGGQCPPPTEDSELCSMPACPYWGQWGGCNVSCGNGIRKRTKVCPGEQCPPPTEDSEQCSMPACPYWGPWGGCNVSCGNGIRRRNKVCPGGQCSPPTDDSELCSMPACPYWGPWGGCNVSCGNGIRRRTKVCPGEQCPPPTEDSEQCSMPACPYWGPWGGCNVSCGNGIRRRTKVCPGGQCPPPTEDSELCFMPACPVNQICDVCFVIDSSGSINDGNPGNWDRVLNFTADVAGTFDISSTGTRIAAIIFERKYEIQFYLDNVFNKSAVVDKIRGFRYLSGGTYTDAALKAMHEQIFVPGRGDRPDVKNVALLISDGESEYRTDPIRESDKAKAKGITILSVGVNASDSGNSQLRRIASSESHFFTVKGFTDLQSIVAMVAQRTCGGATAGYWGPWGACSVSCGVGVQTRTRVCSGRPCPTSSTESRACSNATCPVNQICDVCFVIDSSGSINDGNPGNWDRVLNFTADVAGTFDISSTGTRTAAIIFERKYEIQFYLDNVFNKSAVVDKIRGFRYLSGGTYTDAALKAMHEQIFVPGRGDRPDVKNVALLISDGESEHMTDPIRESDKAKVKGITILSVGVNASDSGNSQLRKIASSESHFFTVKGFIDLQSIVAMVAQRTCGGAPAGYWGPWGACSVSCDAGVQTRTRICSGRPCPTFSTERRSCSNGPCSPPEQLEGHWGRWSPCSESCGGGGTIRTWSCISPGCRTRVETKYCSVQRCP